MGSRHLYLVAASVLALAGPAAAAPLLGFSETGTQTQRALEATFDSHLSAADIQARHRDMASQPNHVGSAHDKANAEATLARFKSWGWDAKIETFDVLFPTPKTVKLELLGDQPFTATLTERALPEDPATATADALPAYTAYQGDGDVTAEVVYVNYGMPSDYDTLERLGVSVKGKIVLARYGAGWRGLKPKLAQEHGAVGCIIYSDPSDDGFALGDVYPKGGYRPDQAFQRGSVMDMPIHPGDPATPGYGSTKGAKRLSREDTKTILKIPVLPISYGDAKPFLTAMGGEVVPKGWRGGLAQTYRVGPTSVKAHLVVESDWGQKRLYDVIARLPGKDRPNEW
ncbi:MAG: PA domain-containing protein, partial [Caulobacteraceae bacterium]